jgi:ABC-type branched-subunit amino acid transport system substrate-binding protein
LNTRSLHIIKIGGILANDTSMFTAFKLAINELSIPLQQKHNITLQYELSDSKNSFHTAVIDATQQMLTSVQGIVGGKLNLIAKAIAQTCTDFNIAQIGYGANAAELSLASLYPTFARIYPSNGFEAYILANLIGNVFGWKRVVLLPTTNQYGTIATSVFTYYAKQFDIEIIQSIAIPPGTGIRSFSEDILVEQIKNMAMYDARIWVFLSDDITAVANFFYIAKEQNILSSNTHFLGGSAITTMNLFHENNLSYSFLHSFLNGYIGIKPADNEWMNTSKGQSFLTKLQNIMGKGLHPISPLSAYVYDAVYVLVNGITNYYLTNRINLNNKTIPFINGIELNKYIIKNTSFHGITGLIQLIEGLMFLNDYGSGDREVGVQFEVLNYQNINETVQGMYFKRIGTFTPNQGIDYSSTIKWGTPYNEIPMDRPEPIVVNMSSSLKSFIMFMFICVFLSTSFVFVFVVMYQKSRLLKASQLPMLYIILISLYFAAARIVVSMFEVSSDLCITRYWMGHLAFTAVMTFLSKTLRVHLLVNNNFKKLKITSVQCIFFILLLLSVSLLNMIVITSVYTPHVKSYYSTFITGQYTYYYYCTTETYDWALFTYEMIILLVSVKLCYDTRSVPDAVNESKVISKVIFFIMIICSICFPCIFELNLHPYQYEIIIDVAYFLCSMFILLQYFMPKLLLLLNGNDLDRHMKFTNNHRVSDTSIINNNELLKVYMPKLPKSIQECNELVLKIQTYKMMLEQRATQETNATNSNQLPYSQSSASNEHSLANSSIVEVSEHSSSNIIPGGSETSLTLPGLL